MKLRDLLTDLVDQLPEDRRKLVEAMANEFGAGEDFQFLLTLVAGSNKRQWRVVRLLLNELEALEIAKERPGNRNR